MGTYGWNLVDRRPRLRRRFLAACQVRHLHALRSSALLTLISTLSHPKHSGRDSLRLLGTVNHPTWVALFARSNCLSISFVVLSASS